VLVRLTASLRPPPNDRVVGRIVPARRPRADRKAIVFHHALLQKHWALWEWFVAPLARASRS
jgi:hypothetical protein